MQSLQQVYAHLVSLQMLKKPTMVNHGDKINLFELEQLIDKFKNGNKN